MYWSDYDDPKRNIIGIVSTELVIVKVSRNNLLILGILKS